MQPSYPSSRNRQRRSGQGYSNYHGNVRSDGAEPLLFAENRRLPEGQQASSLIFNNIVADGTTGSYVPPKPTRELRSRPSHPANHSQQSTYRSPVEVDHSMLPPSVPSIVMMRQENPAEDLAIGCLSHGCLCVQCVRTQELGFTEKFGKFQEIIGPGCYCMCWPLSDISGRLSLRIQQLDIVCESKTLDNVFCHVTVSIMYRVVVEQSYIAFYRPQHIQSQIKSYVLDVVRGTVPNIAIDQLFESKRKLSDVLFSRLCNELTTYGYELISTLLTHVAPNIQVQESMNEISASRRLKLAASHKAEGFKSQIVNHAKGQAEALYLMGVGVARERTAIVRGMQDCVNVWTDVDVRVRNPPTPKEVMDILLVTQYLDLLDTIGCNNIFMTHGIGEVANLRQGLALADSS